MASVGAAAGALWTWHQADFYLARCTLNYGQEQPSSSDKPRSSASAREWFRTQQYILQSDKVVADAAEQLGLTTAELRSAIEVAPIEGTQLVHVQARAPDAARAMKIANTLAAAYIDFVLRHQEELETHSAAWIDKFAGAASARLMETEGELQRLLEAAEAPTLSAVAQTQLASELGALRTQAVNAQIRRIELAARLKKLQAAAALRDPFEAHTREIEDDPLVKRLREEHVMASLTKLHVAAQDGEGPALNIARAHDAALRDAMRAAVNRAIRSTQAELNATQRLETELEHASQKLRVKGQEHELQQLRHRRLTRTLGKFERVLAVLRARSAAPERIAADGMWAATIVEPASSVEPVQRAWALQVGLGALLPALATLLLIRSPCVSYVRENKAEDGTPAQVTPNGPRQGA